MIAEITAENFESEVRRAAAPVLLDFWADWCGPCRMLAPTMDELAAQFDGKVKFGKVNVDRERQLAAAFEVESIPTLLLFKNGEVAGRSVGAVPKRQLMQMLEM